MKIATPLRWADGQKDLENITWRARWLSPFAVTLFRGQKKKKKNRPVFTDSHRHGAGLVRPHLALTTICDFCAGVWCGGDAIEAPTRVRVARACTAQQIHHGRTHEKQPRHIHVTVTTNSNNTQAMRSLAAATRHRQKNRSVSSAFRRISLSRPLLATGFWASKSKHCSRPWHMSSPRDKQNERFSSKERGRAAFVIEGRPGYADCDSVASALHIVACFDFFFFPLFHKIHSKPWNQSFPHDAVYLFYRNRNKLEGITSST